MTEPTFHNIDKFGLVASAVENRYYHAGLLKQLIFQSRDRPNVLTENVLRQTKYQGREGIKVVCLYREQITRWEFGSLTAAELNKVGDLKKQVESLNKLYEDVLNFIAQRYGYAENEVYPSRGKAQALKELQEATDYMVIAILPHDDTGKRPTGLHISQMHLLLEPLQQLSDADDNFYEMLSHIVAKSKQKRS